MCVHVMKQKKCHYIGNCSFAHSSEERDVWTYMKNNSCEYHAFILHEGLKWSFYSTLLLCDLKNTLLSHLQWGICSRCMIYGYHWPIRTVDQMAPWWLHLLKKNRMPCQLITLHQWWVTGLYSTDVSLSYNFDELIAPLNVDLLQ